MKVRKSIPAFVLGLLSNLFCLVFGFYIALIGDLFGSLGGAISGEGGLGEAWIIVVLGWVCMIGAIIGIVGCAKCFKKAKIGGILLAVACGMTGSLLIYMFVTMLSSTESMMTTSILIYLIPFAMNVIAMICAFTAKEEVLHQNVYPNNYIPNQNGQMPNNYQNFHNGMNNQYGQPENYNYTQQNGPYNQQFGPYNQNNNYGQNGHANQTNMVDDQKVNDNNSGDNK